MICVLYAIFDEIHQLYVPGRSGEIIEVLIDSVGAGVGIGLQTMYVKLQQKKRLKDRSYIR